MPDLRSFIANIIGLINYVIPVLVTVALAIFLWGMVRFIYNTSPKGKAHDKEMIFGGLIALFVITSVWGLVALMCLNFFGNQWCQPGGGAVPYTQSGNYWGATNTNI